MGDEAFAIGGDEGGVWIDDPPAATNSSISRGLRLLRGPALVGFIGITPGHPHVGGEICDGETAQKAERRAIPTWVGKSV